MKNPLSGVGWLIVVGILLFAFSYVPSHHRQNTDCTKHYIGQTVFSSVGVGVEPVIKETRQDRQNRESQKREFEIGCSDLAAQWVVADYAHRAFWIGIVGIGFIFMTLRYTHNASDAASETLGIAQRTLEEAKNASYRELRAYLSVKVELIPTQSFQTQKYILTITNLGQTPAYNVRIDSMFSYKKSRDNMKGLDINTVIGPTDNFRIVVDTGIEQDVLTRHDEWFLSLGIYFIDHRNEGRVDRYFYSQTKGQLPRKFSENHPVMGMVHMNQLRVETVDLKQRQYS